MRAGEMRDRVTIQANTQSADAMGSAGVDSWGPISTRPVEYAAIETLSGREFFEAQRMAAEVSHRIRLRYRSDYTSVLTPKHRLTYGTRTFDILATLEVDRRRELHVLVTERV